MIKDEIMQDYIGMTNDEIITTVSESILRLEKNKVEEMEKIQNNFDRMIFRLQNILLELNK